MHIQFIIQYWILEPSLVVRRGGCRGGVLDTGHPRVKMKTDMHIVPRENKILTRGLDERNPTISTIMYA